MAYFDSLICCFVVNKFDTITEKLKRLLQMLIGITVKLWNKLLIENAQIGKIFIIEFKHF